MFELKPSNIFYSQNQISATFGRWNRHRNKGVGETLDDLCEGRCRVSNVETINVVKRDGKWVTLDNRRLWVFHHLEAAGKCKTIPVIEVHYCSIKHGRKFDSTNGGKYVKFIKGRSPGGLWYKQITPVIPTPVVQVKNIVAKSKKGVERSDELEKNNTNTSNHVTTVKVDKQPSSVLITSTKDEKYQLGIRDETCGRWKAKSQYKFSINDNDNAITRVSIKPSWKQSWLFNNTKCGTSSWKLSGRSSSAGNCNILFQSNSLKYRDRNSIHRAFYRFKPYHHRRKNSNDLEKYANITKCKSRIYERGLNNLFIDQRETDSDERDEFQDIDSENDLLDEEFSIFVDERENSDYEDVQMSASDNDSKEIDYGDDTWSDADEAFDVDTDYVDERDDDKDPDKDEEEKYEEEERKNNNDIEQEEVLKEGGDKLGLNQVEEKGNKNETGEEKDEWNFEGKSNHDSLIASKDQIEKDSDISDNDTTSDDSARRLQHIWSGLPLADIYSSDFNLVTTLKLINRNNTWLCTSQSGKTKNNIQDDSGRDCREFTQHENAIVNDDDDDDDDDDNEEVDNDYNQSDSDYDADDENGHIIDGDLSGETRSDLEYDELDVWSNEFDENSKYATLNDCGSSDSEDDFLVAKEVENCDMLMDKLVENSRESLLVSSSEESLVTSDTDDEETNKLNIRFNFDDKYERRQRASRISVKRYGYDIFQFDPV